MDDADFISENKSDILGHGYNQNVYNKYTFDVYIFVTQILHFFTVIYLH